MAAGPMIAAAAAPLSGISLHHVRLPMWVRRHLHVGGPLESPWIWRALLALTVVVIALLFYRAVRRRRRQVLRRPLRRWAARGLSGAGVLILLIATGLAWLNSYVGYLPTAASLNDVLIGGPASPGASSGAMSATAPHPSLGPARTSAVVPVRIGAPALRVPTSAAYVYLPPGYHARANAHRRYPVVYLIHGYPGRPADWMVAGGVPDTLNTLIADGQIGPMIVVAPDASGGWLHDSECLDQAGGPQVAEYLTGTVVHYIDRHFRTIATRHGRAIGGISSGGYCALNLGLRHRAEFSTIVGFEPYGTPGMSVLGPLLHGNMVAYRANSPAYYLSTMRFTQPTAAFLDAGGASPGDVARVRSLARELAARGQDVAFRVEPDQTHTWKEAAAGLPYGIYFAAHHLAAGLAVTPIAGRLVSTAGRPAPGRTDAFARRYAAQVARCRRLGPGFRPVGGPTSDRCARAADH